MPFALVLGLLSLHLTAPADEVTPPVTLMFTAGDAPRLAEGIELLAAGSYTVKVWAPARQQYAQSLKVQIGKSQTIALTPKDEGTDAKPGWRKLYTGDFKAGERLRIVSGAANAKTASAFPAFVVVTTDPDLDPSPMLDLARGRLDSVDPPPDPRRKVIRTNQQGADFRAPATEQAWRDRSSTLRKQLLVAQGLWPMFPKTPLHPRVFGKVERDGYTIEKVVLETLPGFTLGGNLYRPTGKAGKLPAVLCPHGHWADGRVNETIQQRCIRLAKLGMVVFMYDMVGYNDSKAFGHEFLNDRLRRWGLSLVTLQTWDSIRVLDWIETLPDVDPARLACTGESGGGTQTFLLAAVDDRLKVVAPVVMVSDWFQGGCVCENCAGLRLGTDNVEIAALAAPRPMKMVGATGDWTAKTMTHAYPAIRGVYDLLGKPERVGADVFDFPHNYNETSRNAVYPFLAYWLLGLDDSEALREGAQTIEKPEDLWAFTDKTPGPANPKTPAALENDLVRALTWEIDALAPGSSASAWEAARNLLKTSHGVRVGLVNPPPADLTETEVRRTSFEGSTAVHLLVNRKSTGESIPVVRLIPKDATGKVTVIASPHGKATLANPHGHAVPLVRALLRRGQSVVAFDPLFVGESADPSSPAARRPATVHYETYNKALAADQMQDLATVSAWARSRPDVREVNIAGLGRAGVQVLLARPSLEGLARTTVDLHEFDPGDGSTPITPDLDLPGLLQFGGVKAASALSAPAPLWVYRTGKAFDRSWPENAYRLADAAAQLKLDASRVEPEALARWIDTGG